MNVVIFILVPILAPLNVMSIGLVPHSGTTENIIFVLVPILAPLNRMFFVLVPLFWYY